MTEAIIEKELINMGFNPIHIGTLYLINAISILYISNKLIYKTNLEKDVYTQISLKYNKNIKTIKSDIIKATNVADIQNTQIMKYNKLKLTPKLVIGIILKRIQNTDV